MKPGRVSAETFFTVSSGSPIVQLLALPARPGPASMLNGAHMLILYPPGRRNPCTGDDITVTGDHENRGQIRLSAPDDVCDPAEIYARASNMTRSCRVWNHTQVALSIRSAIHSHPPQGAHTQAKAASRQR